MNIMIISVTRRVNILELCQLMMLTTQRLFEDVHIPPKTVSIFKDIAVGFETLIINETQMSSDSASNDVNVIVEPNTTTIPSKPVESTHAEYSFMIIPTDLSFRESPECLAKI